MNAGAKFMLLASLLGCMLASPPMAATQVEPGEPLVLTYASPYSPNHPFSQADQDWIDFVEQQSAGRLKIRSIWAGALLSSDQSMIELRHGVADIGLITPIYAKGGAHLLRAQTGFYSGTRTAESQVELYRCVVENDPEIRRELAGLKILAVQGGNLPGIVTRDVQVKELADLRGLRIRGPTELLPILSELGADPVSMPMGEVYSALAKGVIDGVVAPSDTFRSLHLAEIARYFFTLEVPRGAYPARAMGQRRWDSLPPEIQQVLEQGIPVWEAALAERTRQSLETGMAYGLEQGMQVSNISVEEQRQFDTIYLRDAERTALALQSDGIEAEAMFLAARASVNRDGLVECQRSP
jgi:TRAP-type C4-dicarboxylate transport system substrate-binding protein